MVNICTIIALSIINIVSISQLLQYGDDVLKNDGTNIIHFQVASSIFTLITVFLFAMLKILYNRVFGEGVNFISITAISISMNLIYIVSHHMPYMLLAFIYSPVQTSLTYLAFLLYILCVYLGFSSYESHFKDKHLLKLLKVKWARNSTVTDVTDLQTVSTVSNVTCTAVSNYFKKCAFHKLLILQLYGIIYAVIFFTVILLYIIRLGSFDDFKGAQNLALPLVIGMFTFLLQSQSIRKQYEVILQMAVTVKQVYTARNKSSK